MALISLPTAPNLSDVPTAQAYYAKQISGILNRQLPMIVSNFNQIHNMVWNNKYLTPQQVCDALGTNAGELFTIAHAIISLVNSIVPNTLPVTTPMTVTINQDGSVTLS
jgi:hypothetical protein